MSNPFNRLKYLPWRSLAQAAGGTLLFVVAIEWLLGVGQVSSPWLTQLLENILKPPFGIVTLCVVAFAIGALSVAILEKLNRSAINTTSLWGLVLCLLLAFLVRRLLPIPAILFKIDSVPLTLVIVGVFWRGQPYWGSFRRW